MLAKNALFTVGLRAEIYFVNYWVFNCYIYNKSCGLKNLGGARELCLRVLLEISSDGLKHLNQRRPDRRLQICGV